MKSSNTKSYAVLPICKKCKKEVNSWNPITRLYPRFVGNESWEHTNCQKRKRKRKSQKLVMYSITNSSYEIPFPGGHTL